MLSPTLKLNSSSTFKTPLSNRLTSESALAGWLGEPIATIVHWRIPDLPGPQIRYRIGSVCDWIMDHVLPVFSENINSEENPDVQFGDIAAVWTAQIPAMKVSDRLIGFFRSIVEESEPSDYAMVGIPTLPFRSSELAKVIENELDKELIRDGFNIVLWLWQQLLENKFHSIKEDVLIAAFKAADRYRVDLNFLSQVLDDQGQQLFHGNVSHLLADTEGDFFHLHPFNEFDPCYERLVDCALNLGLNIDTKNNHGLTARHIAFSLEEKYGQGQSIFKNFIEKYESAQNLAVILDSKFSKQSKRSIKQ